jgi:hypothetical protein
MMEHARGIIREVFRNKRVGEHEIDLARGNLRARERVARGEFLQIVRGLGGTHHPAFYGALKWIETKLEHRAANFLRAL